jgi:hypothetical protein
LTFIFNLNFILKTIFIKKPSVRVRFSHGRLSGERCPQRNVLQCGGNTPHHRSSSPGALFPLLVAPAEFYFLLEDECSGESSSGGVLQICRERNFPERKLSVVCSGGVLLYKYGEHHVF